jgi:hypothetical protein
LTTDRLDQLLMDVAIPDTLYTQLLLFYDIRHIYTNRLVVLNPQNSIAIVMYVFSLTDVSYSPLTPRRF